MTLAQKKGANFPPHRAPWHSSHIWSSNTYGFTSTCWSETGTIQLITASTWSCMKAFIFLWFKKEPPKKPWSLKSVLLTPLYNWSVITCYHLSSTDPSTLQNTSRQIFRSTLTVHVINIYIRNFPYFILEECSLQTILWTRVEENQTTQRSPKWMWIWQFYMVQQKNNWTYETVPL